MIQNAIDHLLRQKAKEDPDQIFHYFDLAAVRLLLKVEGK